MFWNDIETGITCELFIEDDSDTPYISDECALKPWDDLTTVFENEGDDMPLSINGPGGEIYFFENQFLSEEDDSFKMVSESGYEVSVQYLEDDSIIWIDGETGIQCELMGSETGEGLIVMDGCELEWENANFVFDD